MASLTFHFYAKKTGLRISFALGHFSQLT